VSEGIALFNASNHIDITGGGCFVTQLFLLAENNKFTDLYTRKDELTGRQSDILGFNGLEAGKQFMLKCLQPVVGKQRMSQMGKNYSPIHRKSYEDIITPTDEAYAMLVLEDRWELWDRIYELRQVAAAQLENKDNEQEIYNDSNEDPVEVLAGDEDDQRKYEMKNGEKKRYGVNLTKYSYYGTLAPHYKGFDPNVAANRQNDIKKMIVAFRSSDRGKKRMEQLTDWWGEHVHQGPANRKRKRHVMRTQMAESLQQVEDNDI
jgi:hypothetical protein